MSGVERLIEGRGKYAKQKLRDGDDADTDTEFVAHVASAAIAQ